MMKNLPLALACIILPGLHLAACSPSAQRVGPYSTPSELDRNPELAQRLTTRAVDMLERDPAQAEQLLRDALAADLYHGPAHNNLGVIYLSRDQLYEAAQEFEWAKRLMPGHPDPRVNLAITLERAGRLDDALEVFESAYAVAPHDIGVIQGLARSRVRLDRTEEHPANRATMRELLDAIAVRGESDAWRQWAQQLIARARDLR